MQLKKMFSSGEAVQIFNSETDGKPTIARIEMFRTGIFNHRAYGQLKIDLNFLNNMLENWKRGVYPTKISFDKDHDHSSGSTAWLPTYEENPNALFIRRKVYKDAEGRQREGHVIVGDVELTPLGQELLEKKLFRYFSVEIDPNYQPYEQFEDDTNGKERKKYGPTIKGGGFTNFPFIIGLEPISLAFSDRLSSSSTTEATDHVAACIGTDTIMMFNAKTDEYTYEPVEERKNEEKNNSSEENSKESEYDRKPKSCHGDLADKPIILNEPRKETKMNLSEILKTLAGKSLAEQVSYLQSQTMAFSADTDEAVLLQSVLKDKQQILEKEQLFSVETQRRIAQEKEAENLRASLIQMAQTAEQNKQLAYDQRVQLFCAELEKERHYASAISYAREVLSNLRADQRDLKFSTLTEGGEKELDPFALIKGLFDSLPEDARFSDTEKFNATGEGQAPVPGLPDAEAPKEPAKQPVQDKVDLYFSKHGARLQLQSADIIRKDKRWVDAITEDGELKVAIATQPIQED